MKRILLFMLIALLALPFLSAEEEAGPESLDYSLIQESVESSEIKIEANVKKAEVYLNGIFYGKTPLVVSDLLPGEYVLTVCKAGYNRLVYLIEVRKGYRLTYRLELKKSDSE